MGAREFFETAQEASRDAERCRRQLADMELAALSLPGGTGAARVSGGDHDRMAVRVGALVDREAALHSRIEQDYRLIDLACAILYGADGVSDGLASMAPPWWSDAIYHHYLQGRTWAVTGELLGYSEAHVRRAAAAGFDLMDANGMTATVAGSGGAT